MKKELGNLVIFTICVAILGVFLYWLIPSAEEYVKAEKQAPAPAFYNKQYKIADQVVYYYRTIKIDGCEYLAFPGGLTHKGNCPNLCHTQLSQQPFDLNTGKTVVAKVK